MKFSNISIFILVFILAEILCVHADSISSQSYSIESVQTSNLGTSASSNNYSLDSSSVSSSGTFSSSTFSGVSGYIISCNESWNCTSWSSCMSSLQSRNCTDINNCGSILYRPILNQSCTSGSTVTYGSSGGGGGTSPTVKNITFNTTSNNIIENSPAKTAIKDEELSAITGEFVKDIETNQEDSPKIDLASLSSSLSFKITASMLFLILFVAFSALVLALMARKRSVISHSVYAGYKPSKFPIILDSS